MSEVSGNGDNSYQYTGQERDDEVGLHNFRARMYDSELGKFYAMDPAGQGNTPYWFCGNNSIIYIDQDGKFFGINAFLSGFVDGLFRGKNAWKEGERRSRNEIKILGGLFQSDDPFLKGVWWWYILSRSTWESPQTSLGIGIGLTHNYFGGVKKVVYGYGATLIETKSSNWGAFTLGSYIMASNGTEVGDYTFMHEYGHYIQSQKIGPIYLPVIAPASLYSAANSSDEFEHHRFWTEKWADDNALEYFGDKYRPYWEYFHSDSKSYNYSINYMYHITTNNLHIYKKDFNHIKYAVLRNYIYQRYTLKNYYLNFSYWKLLYFNSL